MSLETTSLLPIIGVNECGKTTILEAILAFDHYSDKVNDGRHLLDVENLYSYEDTEPRITAVVGMTWEEILDVLRTLKVRLKREEKAAKAEDEDTPEAQAKARKAATRRGRINTGIESYKRKRRVYSGELSIVRRLKTRSYAIVGDGFSNAALNSAIVEEILRRLPYILYFDDFRHDVPDRIPIVGDGAGEWQKMMEVLFRKTNRHFSVTDLAGMDERKRKGLLAKVEKRLNETLRARSRIT